MPCRTREKKDGSKYTNCYDMGGGSGGKGGKLSGPELMAKYGKVSVNAINKALEANKKGSSASGGMAKLKVNKLLKLQAGGGLGKLPAQEGVPPKQKAKKKAKAPSEGVPPASKKKKAVPKGSHKMPDGSIMKDSAMEGVPPVAKPAEGVPPMPAWMAGVQAVWQAPQQAQTNILGLAPGEDPFPGFAKPTGGVGQKPPGDKVSKHDFMKARAGMMATMAKPPPFSEGVPPASKRKKKGGY